MIRTIFTLSLSFLISCMGLYAQEQTSENQGRLSGSVDATGNFFIRDTAIGAFNIPQYDYQKFGAQSWFNLNYSNYGFDMGIRFDLFNNSNLLVPTQSYTAQGIGNWYIKKNVNKFNFAAGYIYDQIGSGIIFRAFEERPLAIDNALYGVRVGYQPVKDINIKAFTGKQKQQFDSYGSVIKGISVDGFFSLGDSLKPWTFSPGFGVVGRTFDKPSIDQMVSSISTYTVADSLVPQYNTYAFSAFNTLNAGPFTWYIEEHTKVRMFSSILLRKELCRQEILLLENCKTNRAMSCTAVCLTQPKASGYR